MILYDNYIIYVMLYGLMNMKTLNIILYQKNITIIIYYGT
jgi:hypothetical protein